MNPLSPHVDVDVDDDEAVADDSLSLDDYEVVCNVATSSLGARMQLNQSEPH